MQISGSPAPLRRSHHTVPSPPIQVSESELREAMKAKVREHLTDLNRYIMASKRWKKLQIDNAIADAVDKAFTEVVSAQLVGKVVEVK